MKNPEENEKSPLKRYLENRQESVMSFSNRSRISHVTILKAVHGKPIRIDTARRIVRHSKNQLTLKDLGFDDDSKSS